MARPKRQPVPTKKPAEKPTPFGWRRSIASCADCEVHLEHMAAGARTGTTLVAGGHLIVIVQIGALWAKDLDANETTRFAPGTAFIGAPGKPFQVATGRTPATFLVVEPTGLTMKRDTAGDKRVAVPLPRPRAPQLSRDERAHCANAAQGLDREVALPAQPRTAEDVHRGLFNQGGSNLRPVLPQP